MDLPHPHQHVVGVGRPHSQHVGSPVPASGGRFRVWVTGSSWRGLGRGPSAS